MGRVGDIEDGVDQKCQCKEAVLLVREGSICGKIRWHQLVFLVGALSSVKVGQIDVVVVLNRKWAKLRIGKYWAWEGGYDWDAFALMMGKDRVQKNRFKCTKYSRFKSKIRS